MNGSAFLVRCAAAALALGLSPVGTVAAGDDVAARHLGVATCASALCHAAPQPLGDVGIRQNEYLVWHRNDRHAGAWRTLESARSQRIAERLGDQRASEREDCLACHAAPVTADQVGPRFRVADGVDCETCHGRAEHWIDGHTRGYRDEGARLADGLYPTWDASARATLCLGCHLGAEGGDIDHRIMAAGHPPLRFELDTYTTSLPPHFRREQATAIGKPAYSPVADWRTGQLQAARAMLDRLERLDAPGRWVPEPSLFDCHACHHDLHEARWHPQRSPALPTGHPRLAEHPLVMLQLWLDTAKHPAAGDWSAARMALDAGVTGSAEARRTAAARLRALIDAQLAAPAEAPGDPRALALGMLHRADSALVGDFALAEQVAMLSAVLVNELRERRALRDEARSVRALERLYEAVADSRRFDRRQWRNALWALIGTLEA